VKPPNEPEYIIGSGKNAEACHIDGCANLALDRNFQCKPTPTLTFTLSPVFGRTGHITKSDTLSPSLTISSSVAMSESGVRTRSFEFKESRKLTISQAFDATMFYSQSEPFSFSSVFSSSKSIMNSDLFSPTSVNLQSVVFSFSSMFLGSQSIPDSLLFSSTSDHFHSSMFSWSSNISKSKLITNSQSFSGTGPLLQSALSSESSGFGPSLEFPISQSLDRSPDFDRSEQSNGSSEMDSSFRFSESGSELFRSELFIHSTLPQVTNSFTSSDSFPLDSSFAQRTRTEHFTTVVQSQLRQSLSALSPSTLFLSSTEGYRNDPSSIVKESLLRPSTLSHSIQSPSSRTQFPESQEETLSVTSIIESLSLLPINSQNSYITSDETGRTEFQSIDFKMSESGAPNSREETYLTEAELQSHSNTVLKSAEVSKRESTESVTGYIISVFLAFTIVTTGYVRLMYLEVRIERRKGNVVDESRC
jgi:hypothetical protein